MIWVLLHGQWHSLSCGSAPDYRIARRRTVAARLRSVAEGLLEHPHDGTACLEDLESLMSAFMASMRDRVAIVWR